MADNRRRGSGIKLLARAAQRGTLYRRNAEEWARLLGVSRQRFHQIRSLLRLPTRRALIRRALTEELSWKARAKELWRLGIYDRRGDCWAVSRTNSVRCIGLNYGGPKGSKRKVLFWLRYGRAQAHGCFDRPTCGHGWCIKPEHQDSLGIGALLHRYALPRAERIAVALEAGQRQSVIARREGVHLKYVSQINTGERGRGVRKKYPIRAPLTRTSPQC